jgi:hypothetical protein
LEESLNLFDKSDQDLQCHQLMARTGQKKDRRAKAARRSSR